MSATISPPAALVQTSPANSQFNGAAERRRRKRAKITAQVHVRLSNSGKPSEEICMSIDVSRDGILFTSGLSGYVVGQKAEITFPYSGAATALNKPEPAEIVRVTE